MRYVVPRESIGRMSMKAIIIEGLMLKIARNASYILDSPRSIMVKKIILRKVFLTFETSIKMHLSFRIIQREIFINFSRHLLRFLLQIFDRNCSSRN